jgi:hypothetical protein
LSGCTSSSAGGLAQTSASPARELASLVLQAVSGSRCSASLASYDPSSLSLKMSQLSLLGDSTLSSADFPIAGTTRSGSLFELPTLARLIGELGSSSSDGDETPWPTPMGYSGDRPGLTKLDIRARGMYPDDPKYWPTPRAEDSESAGAHKDRGPDTLTSAARTHWPTPTAGDAKASGSRNLEGSKAHAGVSLTDAVLHGGSTTPRQASLWATPTGHDADSPGGMSTRGDKRPTPDGLAAQVRAWPTPTAQDAKNDGGPSQMALASDSKAGHRVADPTGKRGRKLNDLDLWPTPSATPYGSTNNGHPRDGRREEYATRGTPSLEGLAKEEPTRTGTSGVLNPDWVETLLGVPVGWTDGPRLRGWTSLDGSRRASSSESPPSSSESTDDDD